MVKRKNPLVPDEDKLEMQIIRGKYYRALAEGHSPQEAAAIAQGGKTPARAAFTPEKDEEPVKPAPRKVEPPELPAFKPPPRKVEAEPAKVEPKAKKKASGPIKKAKRRGY